ncbi:MAG: class I SAM-dependent methyltransferase [Candidatus Bathyarchaeota archaeon]|nr:class I SAM-dependent methyltransferase [Candidatus Bathyarchaeota archaeon]
MRRNWGAQWNIASMKYLLDSGPDLLFKSAIAKVDSHDCIVLGAGKEVALVNEYCPNIIGINLSKETLQRIRRFNTHRILADAQKLPIKDSCVDLVVCKSALHHFSNLNDSILEIKRVTVQRSYVFLYEPGLLNIIAFLGRKVFPTNIHDPTERPFVLSILRRTLAKHFEIVNEMEFFVFVHIIPILENALKLTSHPRLLKGLSSFDELLCKTFFKNFCWIMTFTLRKKYSLTKKNM